MTISLIAVVARNRVIGKEGTLPWRLPADQKHFRDLTLGKPVIMGRKTFESIGKPLLYRKNIVLTHDLNYRAKGCIIVHSPQAALSAAKGANEVMVIGGAEVYREFLPMTERIYLTELHADFEGDTYFPEFDHNEWQEKERQDFQPDEKNSYLYSFVVLDRKQK